MNVYLLETARALAERGIQVDIFTRHHDPLDPMIIDLIPGARVIHLPAGPPSTDKTGVFDLLPEFTKQVKGFTSTWSLQYDLVASHYWLSGLVGIELSEAWNVPHSTSFHTLASVKQAALPGEYEHPARHCSETQVARTADQVVVWTDHERDVIRDTYGVCDDRITIAPPGVDAERFSPVCQTIARKELGLNGEKAVLYVGRLERLKGIDTLFKAISLLDHVEHLKLFVAGGSHNTPEMDRLVSLAADLGISDRVEFLGSVPQERLQLYYSATDVCVLPSYYESFGFAALEAAACGKPVVASRVGGLTTIVDDGATGFLVNWRCPGPFVERLELLLNDQSLRERMGQAARARAEQFSWDAAIEHLINAYSKLLKDRASTNQPEHAVT